MPLATAPWFCNYGDLSEAHREVQQAEHRVTDVFGPDSALVRFAYSYPRFLEPDGRLPVDKLYMIWCLVLESIILF
jgi:hypothetical protein